MGLGGERLPAAVETALFRIVQEALTDIVQHANAYRVSLLSEPRRRILAKTHARSRCAEKARPGSNLLIVTGRSVDPRYHHNSSPMKYRS